MECRRLVMRHCTVHVACVIVKSCMHTHESVECCLRAHADTAHRPTPCLARPEPWLTAQELLETGGRYPLGLAWGPLRGVGREL